MSYADTLSPEIRKKAQIHAILSTCFGCVSEILLDSTAIITLYFFALGGNASMAVLASGLSSAASTFLYIVSACSITAFGLKRIVKYSCLIGMAGLLLMASAPYWGVNGKYIALIGCFFYCIQRPFYGTAWYPLLDNFLRSRDRGFFFGVMRFTYTLAIGIPFFIVGLYMNQEASMVLMQIIIAAAGILLLGRWLFINLFPMDPDPQIEPLDVKKALGISLRNRPLIGYAIYVCFFSIAYMPIYPLMLAYLKECIHLTDGQIQLCSSVWIGGQVLPFLLYGFLLQKTSLRFLEITVHLLVFLVALSLFLLPAQTGGFFWIAMFLILLLSSAQSCFMCNNSGEMLALARPGNKNMATAFVQTYTAIGTALGRNLASAVLGVGLLAPYWQCGGVTYNQYQTLFLGCAIIALIVLLILPVMSSMIPDHEDYYNP